MLVNEEVLEQCRETFELYKIKTISDLDMFMTRDDVNEREKLETLYITYAYYNDIMDYIEQRISDLNNI